jgi:hypothetical protein
MEFLPISVIALLFSCASVSKANAQENAQENAPLRLVQTIRCRMSKDPSITWSIRRTLQDWRQLR